MKVAILSGKGGTGKTFVAVNLALAAGDATYIDCDVEEPNGRLFLKPGAVEHEVVNRYVPTFNADLCTGCRACVDFCRFNALAFVGTPFLLDEVCHSCGGCALVCPAHAVSLTPNPAGEIETGQAGGVRVVTGIMNKGEASALPIIKAALAKGAQTPKDAEMPEDTKTSKSAKTERFTVIDCPPGSACSVMESIRDADVCIVVAEPTAFGFHNFQMVYELVTLMNKPCFAVVNKEYEPYEPFEAFCKAYSLPVALRIPYTDELAKLGAEGTPAIRHIEQVKTWFTSLLDTITKETPHEKTSYFKWQGRHRQNHLRSRIHSFR